MGNYVMCLLDSRVFLSWSLVLLSSLIGTVTFQHNANLSDICVVSRYKRSPRSGQLCDKRMRLLTGTLLRARKGPAGGQGL